MDKESKIYVAGHTGLAGSAIVRVLRARGFSGILTKTHAELDLVNQAATRAFFEKEKLEYVFLAAAKVGGIHANSTYPADFIYLNLQIQNNVIHNSYKYGVKKLCFLGSSCIYPKFAPQPIKEEYLLDGKLEPTNDAYAVAKIAGIKMCQAYRQQYGMNFISVMPTNLYGPNDNFDPDNSHVLAALVRKFVEAKRHNAASVRIWGTGSPRREFLHVDDMAEACLFLMEKYDDEKIVNVGTGKDLAINELAELVAKEAGYKGNVMHDPTRADGTPRKVLDVSRINALGWKAKISLEEGIRTTVDWYEREYK